MKALKALTAKKAAESQQRSAEGKSWVKRADAKKEEEEKILKEREEVEQKKKDTDRERFEMLNSYFKRPKLRTDAALVDAETGTYTADAPILNDDDDAEPPVPLIEIIARLRDINYPIFLFGESRMATYKRMLMLERTAREQARKGDVSCDLRSDGAGLNTQLTDLRNLHQRTNLDAQADHDSDSDVDLPVAEDDNARQQHYVYKWSRRMLKAWQEELAARPESYRAAIEGKHEIAQYRQSRRDLKPLLKKLKNREVPTNIANPLFEAVSLCDERKFKEAQEKYMELSIGNAAWPVGLNRVSIHMRSAASKIGNATGNAAHILGDETTRKFIMVIKRLLTLSEKLASRGQYGEQGIDT